ncbi:MAG: glucose-1-phosphate thymidylyltransferase [Chloroflexota bacterium]
MKGLVLSGGKGTRLRPFTFTGAKQLVPIANKPVLFYVIEDLVRAGITEIAVIVGETGDQIRAALGNGADFGAEITFIDQPQPLGLAHAVLTAEDWIGASPFVMYLGDNFLRDGIGGLVNQFQAAMSLGACAQILLTPVANPEQFGVAILDGDRISRLVEKPTPPPPGQPPISNLALVGIYMFDQRIFTAARAIAPSPRGELEITDAIQWLIDHGGEVRPCRLDGWWIDTGKMEDLLEANRLVLERLEPEIRGEVDSASTLVGPIRVEEGARITNSVLRGPLTIGAGTEISESFIGPFTAIDHHCVVRRCEVQFSIVMEHSLIEDIDTPIESSVIGRRARVGRIQRRPRAYRLTLGDYSCVEMP